MKKTSQTVARVFALCYLSSMRPLESLTLESYLGRCWEHACEQWKGHSKVELSAGFIAAIGGGICGIIYSGFTWGAIGGVIVGACAGFLIGVLFIFLYYLFLSPKGVDEKRQRELAAAKSQTDKVLEELKG